MIAGVLGFLGARWRALLVYAVVLVYVYGYARYQGYQDRTREIDGERADALANMIDQIEGFQGDALEIISRTSRVTADLNHAIDDIERPLNSTCDLSTVWMRAHSTSVHEANRARAAAYPDPTPGGPGE